MKPIDTITSRLDGCRETGSGKYVAKCPAHLDKSPSLSITETTEGKVLIHCFAGCDSLDVLEAVGLSFNDLCPDDPWKAAYQNATRNQGKKFDRQINHHDLCVTILKIAQAEIEAGKEYGIEDKAWIDLALESVKGAA